MSKIYFRDANFVLSDVIGDFETTDDYLSADAIVCWNDVEGECRDIILTANFLGKPTLVMQHGLRATREYIPPFNAPLISEKILVWGPYDKERLTQSGIGKDRVVVTGTTLFDHLIPKKIHDGFNVVFAPMHWDKNLNENLILADKLNEVNGINVVTKLIDDMDGSYYENPIFSQRTSKDHLDICASVLSTADLVVGINESTFEFLAYKLDIPVMIVDLWEPKYFCNRLFFHEIKSYFSNACQIVSLNELPKAIPKILSNPSQFSLERRKALQEEAGVDISDGLNAKQRIIMAINNAIQNGSNRSKLYSKVEIIVQASRELNNNLKLQESQNQIAYGNLINTLQDVKMLNNQKISRIGKQQNSKLINILNYPICFSRPLLLDDTSAWVEHIPFAMLIVDLLSPKVLVELGTHTGVSYCAFCQAVKQLGLSTSCFAVDTWQGDKHAGYYGEKIFTDLRAFHDVQFAEFSKLLRNTFDNATKYFSDGSIDLLHIDGLHTYEAVKHDFETWLPKMSNKGVILFHDICVRENDFGVWKLWDELKYNYPSFEFMHGYGLGVLAVGDNYPSALDLILKSSINDKYIRDLFFTLGNRLSKELSIQSLLTQLAERESTSQSITSQVEELENQNRNLTSLLTQIQEEISFYEDSKSWKITRPLRKLSGIIRKFWNKVFWKPEK